MDINIKGSQGFQIGNHNTQHNTFLKNVPTTDNEEFQRLVDELKQAVAAHPQLTDNDLNPLSKSVNAIADELEESERDKDIITKQAKRLVQAAETVGKIAPPVLDTAHRIVDLVQKIIN